MLAGHQQQDPTKGANTSHADDFDRHIHHPKTVQQQTPIFLHRLSVFDERPSVRPLQASSSALFSQMVDERRGLSDRGEQIRPSSQVPGTSYSRTFRSRAFLERFFIRSDASSSLIVGISSSTSMAVIPHFQDRHVTGFPHVFPIGPHATQYRKSRATSLTVSGRNCGRPVQNLPPGV